MPPKPNGFYMFMLAEQKKIKAQTNRVPSMKEIPGLCRDAWKRLSPEEKARFENLARQEKQRLQASGGPWAKLDCNRQVIADRKDPVKEENKRRAKEREVLHNSWVGQDSRDIVFHVLDFQVMYDDLLEDHHYPLEIGMVSFSLRKGIINFMHRFIDPGEVPQGNRHLAVSYSENYHKIPLHYEHASADLRALTNHMTEFLRPDSETDELPPVFCLSIHRRLIENCLDFVYSQSVVNDLDQIQKVYCLDDLVQCLLINSGKAEKGVAESQIFDMLRQNRWDYNNSIRCPFHETLDCCFCSLSIVRRFCFALFDILSNPLEFKLTDKHMPEETEQNFIVSDSFGFGRQLSCADNEDRDRNTRPFTKKSSYPDRNHSSRHGEKENNWQLPRVNPLQIPLKDEEESDEEEEEEQTKATEYSYTKLRLPKSLAQVQTQVGQMSLQAGLKEELDAGPSPAPTPSPGGLVYPTNPKPDPAAPGATPIRPMGRGMAPSLRAQMRPSGHPAPPPGIRPPPGFGPRPWMSAPQATRPGLQQASASFSGEHFPALSRGRGLGLGRGWGATS